MYFQLCPHLCTRQYREDKKGLTGIWMRWEGYAAWYQLPTPNLLLWGILLS